MKQFLLLFMHSMHLVLYPLFLQGVEFFLLLGLSQGLDICPEEADRFVRGIEA